MPEDNQGPMLEADSVVVMGINQPVPHLNRDSWKPVLVSKDEWQSLEVALERPLDESLREATCKAIGYFIHSIRLKGRIPTPRQYSPQLRARIMEIIDTADNLLSEITPIGGKPTETDKVSAKTATQLIGGREATWKAAADASRTTQDGDEVWAVEDHVRYLVAKNFPKEFSTTQAALLNLLRALHAMKKEIASIPHNKAGPDGHYELNILLVDLLRIAQAAGDNLDLAPHNIRDNWMGKEVKPNPAYRFVEQATKMILRTAGALVAELQLSNDEQAKLLGYIGNYLDRKPGTLIDPLEAARAIVEGGRRE